MVFTCARTISRPSAVRFDINFLLEGPCAVVVESQHDCDLISKVNVIFWKSALVRKLSYFLPFPFDCVDNDCPKRPLSSSISCLCSSFCSFEFCSC